MISGVLIALYLVALATVDIIKVNVLFFRQSLVCSLLNSTLYVSLLAFIIFKTCSSGYVSVQIILPFKHQCGWLKWVGVVTVLIWNSVILTYIFGIVFIFSNRLKHNFDMFCSIGWCDTNIAFNIFHVIIYHIVIFSICSHIFAVSKVYMFLQNQQKCASQSNMHYSVHSVTCKLILSNISEFMCTVYLAIILTFKLSNHLQNIYLCLNLFHYVFPISIFSLFK